MKTGSHGEKDPVHARALTLATLARQGLEEVTQWIDKDAESVLDWNAVHTELDEVGKGVEKLLRRVASARGAEHESKTAAVKAHEKHADKKHGS